MNDLIIYQKTYDFILYFFPIIERFPKHEKFALQSQIKNCCLEIQKGVIRANKSRNKRPILFEIDINLEIAKMLIRYSHERKYLSTAKYENASKKLVEIGRLLGGWIKSC